MSNLAKEFEAIENELKNLDESTLDWTFKFLDLELKSVEIRHESYKYHL
jgi:hypothetical protein